MDLSKLSTEDLMALKKGDLSAVSTDGLMHLKQEQASAGPNAQRGQELLNADPTLNNVSSPPLPQGPISKGLDYSNAIGRTGIAALQDMSLEPYKRLDEGNPVSASEIGSKSHLGTILEHLGVSKPAADALIGLGLSVAADPATSLAPAALKYAGKATQAVGRASLRGLGSVGDVMTQGQITAEGMDAARNFSPVEQMMSKTTLGNVGAEYGPQKAAMDEGRAVLRYGDAASDAAVSGQPEKLASFVEQSGMPTLNPDVMATISKPIPLSKNTQVALNSLKKGIADLTPSGDGSQNILLLRDSINTIAKSGDITPAEASGILDAINRIERTKIGNERAIWHSLQGPLNDMRGAIGETLSTEMGQGATDYMQNRDLYHQAALMARGRAGGHLSSMVRQVSAAGDLTHGIATGDVGKTAASLSAFAAHFPETFNAVAGGLRLGAMPINGIAELLVQSPAARQAFTAIVNAEMQKANNPDLAALLASPGQQQPQQSNALQTYLGQPPVPPMPQPQQLAPAAKVFTNTAANKPELYNQVAQKAVQQGNGAFAPFFMDASQMGVDGASQKMMMENPLGFQAASQALPHVAAEAIKSSPSLKAEMRSNVLGSSYHSPEEQADIISRINNGALFIAPEQPNAENPSEGEIPGPQQIPPNVGQ